MRKSAWLVILLFFCLCSAAQAQETNIVITFGGDTVLGTREEWKGKANNFDAYIQEQGVAWPFAKLASVFQADDLTLVNLECVLQKNSKGILKNKAYRFRGDPSYTEILTVAGIESVNIANNHYIDYSRQGQKSTQAALTAGGIAFSGYGTLYVYEAKGYKIGFGGCRETVYKQQKSAIKNDIRKLKEMGCDVIVYSCHWGKEYNPKHNALQQRMARYAVDCGADIVIGTHPHCVQGIGAIQGVPILYSLGNLMFGGTHDMRTFDGLLAQASFRFGEKGYEGVELRLIPVLTSGDAPRNNFQPILAEGEDAKRILRLVQQDSKLTINENALWFPTERSGR